MYTCVVRPESFLEFQVNLDGDIHVHLWKRSFPIFIELRVKLDGTLLKLRDWHSAHYIITYKCLTFSLNHDILFWVVHTQNRSVKLDTVEWIRACVLQDIQMAHVLQGELFYTFWEVLLIDADAFGTGFGPWGAELNTHPASIPIFEIWIKILLLNPLLRGESWVYTIALLCSNFENAALFRVLFLELLDGNHLSAAGVLDDILIVEIRCHFSASPQAHIIVWCFLPVNPFGAQLKRVVCEIFIYPETTSDLTLGL